MRFFTSYLNGCISLLYVLFSYTIVVRVACMIPVDPNPYRCTGMNDHFADSGRAIRRMTLLTPLRVSKYLRTMWTYDHGDGLWVQDLIRHVDRGSFEILYATTKEGLLSPVLNHPVGVRLPFKQGILARDIATFRTVPLFPETSEVQDRCFCFWNASYFCSTSASTVFMECEVIAIPYDSDGFLVGRPPAFASIGHAFGKGSGRRIPGFWNRIGLQC
jgi:hypothetical protein